MLNVQQAVKNLLQRSGHAQITLARFFKKNKLKM